MTIEAKKRKFHTAEFQARVGLQAAITQIGGSKSCPSYLKVAAYVARFDSVPIGRQCEHSFATAHFVNA